MSSDLTHKAPAGLAARLRPMREVLVVALLLVALAVVSGTVSVLIGSIAAIALAAAAALGLAISPAVTVAPQGDELARGDRVRASADLLGRLIAALPDPVAILDRDGVLLAANAGAMAIAPALRRGEPALLALRMPAILEAVRQALATGEPQRAEFSERVPTDRWYEAHVMPLSGAGFFRAPVLVLAFHDLTPLRRMEEMRADFIANASHELRTPLAALSGFIDTLLGAARDDATARVKFLGIMQEQAQRMARLIDDLLSLSRIELNAHVRPQTPVDIVGILRQVIDSLQMLAQERQVEILLAAPPQLLVIGDHDELVRLFVNLIENALKYGGAGKRVEIAVSASARGNRAGEATISVRDFGAGIPPDHLPRLTERFYRVDVGHSRTEGGTGLGLALVKHILTRHGGTLAIDSRLGEGSTFTVHLPLDASEVGAETKTHQ